MRKRKLKVYGLTIHCRKEHRDPSAPWRTQCRYVAAVFSQKEFTELADVPLSYLRNYGCITGNDREIELAMANPHTLIFSRLV